MPSPGQGFIDPTWTRTISRGGMHACLAFPYRMMSVIFRTAGPAPTARLTDDGLAGEGVAIMDVYRILTRLKFTFRFCWELVGIRFPFLLKRKFPWQHDICCASNNPPGAIGVATGRVRKVSQTTLALDWSRSPRRLVKYRIPFSILKEVPIKNGQPPRTSLQLNRILDKELIQPHQAPPTNILPRLENNLLLVSPIQPKLLKVPKNLD